MVDESLGHIGCQCPFGAQCADRAARGHQILPREEVEVLSQTWIRRHHAERAHYDHIGRVQRDYGELLGPFADRGLYPNVDVAHQKAPEVPPESISWQ